MPFEVLRFLKDFGGSIYQDVSVDTMVINKCSDTKIIPLFYPDGLAKPFNATHHYPILAGRDPDGKEHYVTWVKGDDREWCFTSVTDGARFAAYSNRLGETRVTSRFYVLALQRDPSDMQPPYPRAIRGSMDETGPLSWVRFWPNKGGGYDKMMSQCGRTTSTWLGPDDEDLEAFLEEVAASVDETDTKDTREDKLASALEESGILRFGEQKSVLSALFAN